MFLVVTKYFLIVVSRHIHHCWGVCLTISTSLSTVGDVSFFRQIIAIASIHQALKPGGRFVAEFGGKGNILAIATALYSALESIGIHQTQVENPWYYPSIGEYTTLLEQQGFDAIYAILFPRPTPLAEGEAGIANWIKMFAGSFFAGLSPEQQIEIISVIEEYLKPTLYQQGTWTADYRRIRIVAVKL